ncbi:MAG: hypothetical protein M9894_28175 [Planctomycetes bacterium]|nr:hypothetical protein [Planctomycetota bacterium]
MKARRLSPWLAFPLALGLLGCPDDDAPYDQPMHDPAVQPGEEQPGWEGTYEDPMAPQPGPTAPGEATTPGERPPLGEPDPTETGVPPVPQETGDPMYRGGGTTGDGGEGRPQPTQRDQVHPGQ